MFCDCRESPHHASQCALIQQISLTITTVVLAREDRTHSQLPRDRAQSEGCVASRALAAWPLRICHTPALWAPRSLPMAPFITALPHGP